MSLILSAARFSHPEFTTVQCEQDVTGLCFLLRLSKDGHGAEIYSYNGNTNVLTRISTDGTYNAGMLRISQFDGNLYHTACDANGNIIFEDKVAGWTVHPALARHGLT